MSDGEVGEKSFTDTNRQLEGLEIEIRLHFVYIPVFASSTLSDIADIASVF